jgi:hypothetical protein
VPIFVTTCGDGIGIACCSSSDGSIKGVFAIGEGALSVGTTVEIGAVAATFFRFNPIRRKPGFVPSSFFFPLPKLNCVGDLGCARVRDEGK